MFYSKYNVNKSTDLLKKYFLSAFIPSFIYAIVRYNIFKEVPWENLPLWITNKAFAMTATILIGYAFCAHKSKPCKDIGILGFYIAIIHSIISFIILKPAYFAKFFADDGKLNFIGETSILAGVLCLSLLLFATYRSYPAVIEESEVDLKLIHRLVFWAMFLNLIHLFVMGYSGWLKVTEWPGMLPPITLISFIITLLYLAIRLFKRKPQA